MLFNSYVFIFAFLPVALGGYYALNRLDRNHFAKAWLVCCSLFFYGYFNVAYLWIIIVSVIVNYSLCRYLAENRDGNGKRRLVLFCIGLLFNFGLLFFYKYLDFTLDVFAGLFHTKQVHLGMLLPLGISFFTFQEVSYLVDSFRGNVKPYCFLDYSLFVTFFPQLIAGPIVLHNEMIPQFENPQNHRFNFENFAAGIFVFSRGLAKKVLVADNFGKIVSYGYGHIRSLSSFEAILTILSYTFQIYFDFSGYCDMASGIGLMFNIELPLNFNSPYKAHNIVDFWRKWHITLTRFLTNYVYYPLGGSRCDIVRTYFNILIVFLVSGIWHGAGYTFLVWGLMHGAMQVAYRMMKKTIDKLPGAITWLMTFLFVNLTWVYFRAESIMDANLLISRLFSGGFSLNAEITETLLNIIPISIPANLFEFNGILNIIMILIMAGTTMSCLFTNNVQERKKRFTPSAFNLLTTWVLLVWSILSLSGVSTFLYYNF